MFYYLSQFKDLAPFLNLFKYITFRAGMSAVTTFILCIVWGPIFINYLKKKKIKEHTCRHDCPHLDKFSAGKVDIPTMGGIFVVGSIIISVLLWCDLKNPYIGLTLFTCLYLAVLGFVDDYVKLVKPKHSGLRARTKLFWQVILGCFVGFYVYFTPHTSTALDVPFFKNVAVDIGIFYIPLVALIVIGSTNAVNLTDGLDGLAIGCILIVSVTLAVLCYISGHLKFSGYLFLPYIPNAGELTIFCTAVAGASLGFLWFNSHPATVFMGDTGSLALGGSLAIISVFIKKELLFVLLGGIFVIEAMSVILQVMSWKLFKKRIFKVSPVHHHLQLSGWHESKIIIRFWIIGVILAVITLVTLKVR